MKIKHLLATLLLITSLFAKAQFVTIPDANFVAFLQANYPTCMNGNQMDTTCVDITSATFLNLGQQNISDLTGVKYFNNLIDLSCDNNQLTSLPSLPTNLQSLFCPYNNLVSLPNLPGNLMNLSCYENQITSLPSLPTSLQNLKCHHNQLTSLPSLNVNLQELDCGYNQLTSLPILSTNLQYVYCRNNFLTSLPSLPANLNTINCQNNQLTSLPSLPANLNSLTCSFNNLMSLPFLPSTIGSLCCDNNQLTSLPSLPIDIVVLKCSSNQLTSLPSFPPNLQYLYCSNNLLTSLPSVLNYMVILECHHNQLTSLPSLSSNLQTLNCSFNQITSLPNLPTSLMYLFCYNNQLISLPNLPTNLQSLDCDSNNIACFPIFPNSLNSEYALFSIIGNPFTCLPNYVTSMNTGTLAYPLCIIGDTLNNNSNCVSAHGIVGYTYKDNNSNCAKDNGDQNINNISLKLYDNNDNLLAQTYSSSNGIFDFHASAGVYTIKVDTTDMPFIAQCAYPGIDSTLVLSSGNALNVNFSVTCKPGFDVGVQSVVPSGWIFPGQQHQINVMAGDMSNWYNLNCAAGVSGQVQITVTGNVTYNGIASGALTPSVAGNVFTYTISNFGTINNAQDFGLLFTTDTTAQAGDFICVDINVTPLIGDNYANNNSYQFCYQVVNSYDPNMKEVYPVNVLPGFQDWFTYTIHFQNTGSAPAFNIRLTDTLSVNLDLETFQVINYSHFNTVALNNNLLTFRFPNIMLPDSTTNLEGSKGFVQYRIKPKANLPLGTQIRNTANIYFDYNPPIITNTTINEFAQPVSIGSEISNLNNQLYLYPNPSNGIFHLKLKQLEDFKLNSCEVFDIFGQKVFDTKNIAISSSSNFQIDLSNQPNGIYFIKANGFNKSFTKKIIKN